MNLARSSVKLFLAKFLTAGLGFIGITYFARELGASQMGIFFLFQALLGMLAIPANFGLGGAVEKRISEGEDRGTFLSSAILLKIVPIAVLVLVILVFRSIINGYLGAELASFLALAIVLQEAAQLAVAVLKGELRVGETAVLEVVRQVTWVGGGALLIGYGYGVQALIYSLLAGIGVMLLWGWFKSSVSLGRPSINHGRSLFDYGKYNVVSSIGGYFYSWMDVAIIGLFLTQAHVGAYEVAWRVTAVSILFSQAIAATIFPQVSDWSANGAQQRIEDLISSVMTPSLYFVIPAFFGAAVFSEEILRYTFGEEYTIAALVLVILMADKIFQAIQLVIGKSLQAIDKPDLAAKATIASVVANAVLNVVLVLEFGIVGAAVATVLSSLLNDLLHFLYLRKYVSIHFPYREITECLISAVIMGGALLLLKHVYQISTLAELLVFVLAGGLIYGVTTLSLPTLRSRMMVTMNQFV